MQNCTPDPSLLQGVMRDFILIEEKTAQIPILNNRRGLADDEHRCCGGWRSPGDRVRFPSDGVHIRLIYLSSDTVDLHTHTCAQDDLH